VWNSCSFGLVDRTLVEAWCLVAVEMEAEAEQHRYAFCILEFLCFLIGWICFVLPFCLLMCRTCLTVLPCELFTFVQFFLMLLEVESSLHIILYLCFVMWKLCNIVFKLWHTVSLFCLCMSIGCCHKLLVMMCANPSKIWLMLKQKLGNWYGL